MANYAIGDIQGCFNAFMRLIEKIKFNPKKDKLWLLGDIVNRGEDSLSTLRYCVKHASSIVSVLGNHDLHLIACHYGAESQRASDTLTEILEAPDVKSLIQWLLRQRLARYLPKFHCFMSHAGLYPGWTAQQALKYAGEVELILEGEETGLIYFLENMYGNEPSEWHKNLPPLERSRFITNALTRMRFLTHDDKLELSQKSASSSHPTDLTPWFHQIQPERVNKKPVSEKNNDPKKMPIILFGHWAALHGECPVTDIYALDTGCVWGEQLTAMRLEDLKTISVPA